MKKERRPIVITHVGPVLEDGRYPVKREVGDQLVVTADIFKEGHAVLGAAIVFRAQDESAWRESPMRLVDNDGWAGDFPLEANTRYQFTIEAWTDVFASWADETERRRAGSQPDLTSEILEGVELVHRSRASATGPDATVLDDALARLESSGDQAAKVDVLLDPRLRDVVSRRQERRDTTRFDRELEVVVDRPRARFASWYELFPRSQSGAPGRHGTFADCITRLPEVRRMGFDVLYFPPIHPIGRTGRKGRSNSLVAGPDDPGSPWAIGGLEGGHTAVHPELGTLEDFRRLVAAAGALDIEIATGKTNLIHRYEGWLGHIQFSPTDPTLLQFCHEGPWHLLDRIWHIRTDGTGLRLIHKRTMPMEGGAGSDMGSTSST